MAKVAAEFGSTANRYQILAKLAAGGMAEIFLARGASVAGVERYCVLKRILRERASDAQFVQMFVDEARLAAQLQHPNIASVYDVGVLGDSYFFTMEYVHGETVRSLLHRAEDLQRSLPLACVLTITAGAASGLHHAHERKTNDGQPLGIVHRDVSPSNLMVSFEGNVKLVDFGVAKADDRAVETQSGTVKGKISYLSPEQCRAERVDRRSDLFSLGIVMWEMLTGQRLYRRDSDFENMTAIVNELPPPPSSRRPEVPRAVDEIVLRLLAKSVADRFQTADQVVEAIENASMRAGTILSTSALSRLVRDLFGHRPEPWLEVEKKAGPHAPVSLAARPIPEDLGHLPTEELDLGLSNVLDLSVNPASAIREIEDLSAVSEVGAAEPPPARPSRPTIPPPARPSRPTIPPPAPPIPLAQAARASSIALDPTLRGAAPPIPPGGPLSGTAVPLPPHAAPPDAPAPLSSNATPLDAPAPLSSNATLLDAPAPLSSNATPSDAPSPLSSNGTLLGVAAPSPSAAAAVLSAFPHLNVLRGQAASPARAGTAPSEGQVVAETPASPSGPTPLPGSGPRPVQAQPSVAPWNPDGTQARAPSPPPPRAIWPLVVVILGAAAIGVVVVWLSMRPEPARPPQHIPAQPRTGNAGNAGTPEPSNPPPGAPPAADRAAQMPGSGGAAPAGANQASIPAQGSAQAPDHKPAQADPASPRDHELPANARASRGDPALPGTVDAATPPKAAPPGSDRPSPDAVMALYNQKDYPAVVRICSAASVNAQLTTNCFRAACRENDRAQARRWLLASERTARGQMVIHCKALGSLDLGSLLDCPNNTPDCQ